jgi:hypothetical protein
MGINPKNYWTKDICQNEATKYNSRTEFCKNSWKAYFESYKNKWLDEVCSHMIKTKWTKELCQIEANKYKGRLEFQTLSKGAYLYSHKKGWLDEICSHMVPNLKFSMPQLILKDILTQLIQSELLYNDHITIKPKELDIYFPKYKLAFEYNGKNWHNSNEAIKRDSDKLMICNKLGIKLITIDDCGLNPIKYEENIKKQLIDNLNIINEATKLNLTKFGILNTVISETVFNSIMDYKDIKNICDKYDNYKEFRLNEQVIYKILLRHKKLDDFTLHMKRAEPGYRSKPSKLLVKLKIDGIIYNSILEAAKLLNINRLTVRHRLYSQNFKNYEKI